MEGLRRRETQSEEAIRGVVAAAIVLARRYGVRMIAGVRLGIDGSGGADRWKKNHFSDAVAGACIGIAAGRAVGIGGDNPARQARSDPPGWQISWGF